MRKSRFTEEQMIGAPPQFDCCICASEIGNSAIAYPSLTLRGDTLN